MLTGRAYYNHGRWVVDCPDEDCTDARAVYDQNGNRQSADTCARGHHFTIEMPPPQMEAQIAAVLSERPDDADRAWYPKGHERAVLAGLPTGQSIEELHAETRHVAKLRAAQKTDRKQELRAALEAAGITVRADGSFEGAI